MLSKSFFIASVVAFLAVATPANATRVQFWTSRNSCDGPSSQDYQNVGCNTCIDPPLDWYAAKVSEIGNQRWTAHNQDKCTSKSQVAQIYGPSCVNAGGTAIRSIWVSC